MHKQTSSGNLRIEPFSKGLWDWPAFTSFLKECKGPCIGHSPSCFSLQISHPKKQIIMMMIFLVISTAAGSWTIDEIKKYESHCVCRYTLVKVSATRTTPSVSSSLKWIFEEGEGPLQSFLVVASRMLGKGQFFVCTKSRGNLLYKS